MTGLKNGEAKREVMALMPDIDVYLADGHSRKNIYDKFKSEGKIECGYVVFCRWIEKLSDKHPRTIQHPTLPVTKPVTAKAEASPHPKQDLPSDSEKPSESAGLRIARPAMKRFTD